MLSIKTLANCFLQRNFAHSEASISPLKMQKLVYFLHGWNMAKHNESFLDGSFIAWPYGPINEKLFYVFEKYGNNPITEYAPQYYDGTDSYNVVLPTATNFWETFDEVYQKYMPLSAMHLSSLANMKNSPWDITHKNKGNVEIEDNLIRDYFRALDA